MKYVYDLICPLGGGGSLSPFGHDKQAKMGTRPGGEAPEARLLNSGSPEPPPWLAAQGPGLLTGRMLNCVC